MLLHVCCADCFLKLYQSFSRKQKNNLQVLFYNPNICPREEYMARLKAIKKVVQQLDQKIKIIVPAYQPQTYFNNLKKLNLKQNPKNQNFAIPNKKSRCPVCWLERLEFLFKTAQENNIDQVSSTLLSSGYQDVATILKIAQHLSEKYQINFYMPELEKINHQQKTGGFYKQNYCGCLYSLIEKSREKYDL